MELKAKVRAYTNAAQFLKAGQERAFLRSEDQDHPANTLPIPETVTVWIGEKKGRKAGDSDGWVAFIDVTIGPDTLGLGPNATHGTHRLILASESTPTKLYKTLGFDFTYSHFADSVWYREFRKLYGWTNDIRSPQQRAESSRRTLGALALLAGADPAKVAKL